jgi:hypothetical protein
MLRTRDPKGSPTRVAQAPQVRNVFPVLLPHHSPRAGRPLPSVFSKYDMTYVAYQYA